MPRPKKSTASYLEKLETEVESNQSKISMVLGVLIVLVLTVLIFNYFSRRESAIGPAQQTDQIDQKIDVTVENLPGNYTVKEGDTLYLIAQKYYQDGFKYQEIARTNNLSSANFIETGQVLQIPKLPQVSQIGPQDSEFGPAITTAEYTVQEGDWLSKIAARSYGDIFAYSKIAQANNITNPDYITTGMVLTIPR